MRGDDAISGERTYRDECHVDGCETKFIGVSRQEYEQHLRDEHGQLVGDIWERLVRDHA